jgi:hypothetical protein
MTKLALLCATALFLLTQTAAAQQPTSNKIAAEALFDRGLQLMQQGDFAEACTQLEQSQALESGIGTMLYLAECYERLGRIASAWALFREASSAARAEGQSERAQTGASRAAALEARLPKLTVKVDSHALVPGFEVQRDGQPIATSLYGVEVPIDPGEHRVDARAPGKLPWSQTVRAAEGAVASVEVPALQDAPHAPGASAAPASSESSAQLQLTENSNSSDGGSQPLVGIIVGAAGIVAIGVGTIFGASAMSKKDDADARCAAAGTPGDACADARGVELNGEAQDAATLANVFVIGGAALAITGVVLYLTAPSEEAGAAHLALRSSGVATTVSLEGAF